MSAPIPPPSNSERSPASSSSSGPWEIPLDKQGARLLLDRDAAGRVLCAFYDRDGARTAAAGRTLIEALGRAIPPRYPTAPSTIEAYVRLTPRGLGFP